MKRFVGLKRPDLFVIYFVMGISMLLLIWVAQSNDKGVGEQRNLFSYEMTLPTYTNGFNVWLNSATNCELLEGESPNVVTRVTFFAEWTPHGINYLSNNVTMTGGFWVLQTLNIKCPTPGCPVISVNKNVMRVEVSAEDIGADFVKAWESNGTYFAQYDFYLLMGFKNIPMTYKTAFHQQKIPFVLTYTPLGENTGN